MLREGTDRLGGAVDLDALEAFFVAHTPVAPGARDRIATGPYGSPPPPAPESPPPVAPPQPLVAPPAPPPPAAVPPPDAASRPTPPPARPHTTDRTAPVISAARLSRTTLALPLRRASRPTTIRFRSSERAVVTLTFGRTTRGRKVVDGTLRRGAVPGANAIVFRGRVGARLLRARRHALRRDAVDAAGNRGRTRTLSLTVTRR